MAGVINGIGVQQSFPASNTQNVGNNANNAQVNDTVQQPRENEVSQGNAPVTSLQESNVSNSGTQQQASEDVSVSASAESFTGEEERGSIVDITV